MGPGSISVVPATGELRALRLSPSGSLHLSPDHADDALAFPIPQRAAARLDEAFQRGPGHGLFHLGAVEVQGHLGPVLDYWRDLAKLYVTKLCGLLDLDEVVQKGLDVPLLPEESARFLESAPPMTGAEYLSLETITHLWKGIEAAFLEDLKASGGAASRFLREKNELWNMVGRVFFHLAENKARADAPFAFLATCTTRISSQGKLQHVPLGKAVQGHATARNKDGLLSILLPVQKAAEKSVFLKDLVDSGRIFQPQAWRPKEAHVFLKEAPLFEDNGIFVRLPDWWKARQPPRVQVSVTVGREVGVGIGASSLLDFSVDFSVDGEPISPAEWSEILAGTDGLALVKGRWVEVDREKLKGLLEQWKTIQREAGSSGVTFLQAMRLLARVPGEGRLPLDGEPQAAESAGTWLSIEAGEWLRRILDGLRSPAGLEAMDPGADLKAELRPYQKEGMKWLWFLHKLRLGGCLADDMGLGKTIQVLALLLLMKREKQPPGERRPSLLVIPASLIGNWKAECLRFAPGLDVLVAHPSESDASELRAERLERADLVVTTYGMLHRQPWAKDLEWDLVVLDEAQAIKNPETAQTRAVKGLKSRHRIALTGTPVENRVQDLWSIFDFLSPGLLGGAKELGRFVSSAQKAGRDVYGSIRTLVKPYILRRLKTDKRVIADLPDKTEVKVFCGLQKVQAVLYQTAIDELARLLRDAEGIRRRGVILSFLMRFKQICNHPSQWTGDGDYDPARSAKMLRLRDLAEEIASRQEKVLVFTQFREMTAPLSGLLEGVFRRPGLILEGSTAVGKRKDLVEAFQNEEGPPHFVLSLKAGGTGLNLTAASHVVHFDRWWNPAVENQATDRAYRIGQKKNVLVHKLVCRGTVEEKIDAMISAKQGMADEILRDGAEAVLTEMGNEELLRFVSLDINAASPEI